MTKTFEGEFHVFQSQGKGTSLMSEVALLEDRSVQSWFN